MVTYHQRCFFYLHLKRISQKVIRNVIPSKCSNDTHFKLLRQPHIPGNNELTWVLLSSWGSRASMIDPPNPDKNSLFYRCQKPYTRIRNSINSLWPSDVIRQQGSRSTLAHVMACCLTAPCHYLTRFWLMTSEVLWHSSYSNCTEILKIFIIVMTLKFINLRL